jgi:RES domain-containing protein
VIYAADYTATAQLEILVHALQGMPLSHNLIRITIPSNITIERASESQLEILKDEAQARALGDRWLLECRSAALRVPSVAAPGHHNYLLNPLHPDFERITTSNEEPFLWDERHLALTKDR